MKQKTKIILVTSIIFLLVAQNVSAALVTCGGVNPDGSAQPACKLINIITTSIGIINFLLTWAWLVSVVFIVWAGWTMINSGGNEEAVTEGKTIFSHAVIGFFLVMSAFVLLNFIVSLLIGSGELVRPQNLPSALFDALKFLPTP